MERATKITTDVLDANYPLLAQLRELAPGTHHHSKNVALLLERVAVEIDISDSDLVMAGLYHDVGKIAAPHMFTENQTDGANAHDGIAPKASLRFITAHVGDTARILVNDGNIPLHVIRWCTQHHGTSPAKYFLARAKEQDPEVDINLFRYPGPRPECLESALLMICDILEATSRSKDQAGKLDSIDDLVESVIADLVDDEQLDAVELTFGKLRVIKTVLKKELAAQYHKRIDYEATPTPAEVEPRKTKKKDQTEEE